MTIAFDATSESNVVAGDPLSWTHTPSGTPRGVVVGIVETASITNHVSSVTYGGVAMDFAGRQATTSAEQGVVTMYFLGKGIPTGAQTVTVDFTQSVTAWASAITVTAASDMEPVNWEALRSANLDADPEMFIRPITYSGTHYMVGAIFSGRTAAPTAGGGTTVRNDHAFGSNCAAIATSASEIGGLTRAEIQWNTVAISDDVAMLGLSIKEGRHTSAFNTGVRYPGTQATESVGSETDAWNVTGNLGDNDEVMSEDAVLASGSITQRLKATNFGLAIPAEAAIDGVIVEIGTRDTTSQNTMADFRVQLLDAGGALVGDNKADTGSGREDRMQLNTYGTPTDKWNASPTPAMLNDVDFGVVYSVQAVGATSGVQVDFIRLSVFYSIPPPNLVQHAVGSVRY